MPDVGRVSRSYLDYDSEVGTAAFYMPTLTTANYATQQTAITALYSAMDAMTGGVPIRWEHGNMYTDANPVPPASEAVQRELKWLVRYHDNVTGRKGSYEIPAANTARLDPNDRAHAEIGDAAEVDAFVTAFEALVRSPNGNAVTVEEITLVGRRV